MKILLQNYDLKYTRYNNIIGIGDYNTNNIIHILFIYLLFS